ncbi:hypothetical protein BDR22DRAFT_841460 [Usnea florida]
MDTSPGSDRMDWQHDSSLHIIQPPSSPWLKRSFDTYNEPNEPYHANEGYSAYHVTDTLRHQPDLVEPSIDFDGRRAQYVTDFDGNIILQPIIQPKPRQPIGYYLPEVVKWIIYGTALTVFAACEVANYAYVHTATVAVRVGDSAKRRLVEITRTTLAPGPNLPPRRHRRYGPPHQRRSPIIRRVTPTSPGGRTHIPVAPPRARPTATLDETAVNDHNHIADSATGNLVPLTIGAFVTSLEDDQAMSDISSESDYEPMMSGALQDMETNGGAQLNAILHYSPFHVPGTFPDSPASSLHTPTPIPPPSDGLASSLGQSADEKLIQSEQAVDELDVPCSEASDESDEPEVRIPVMQPPLENVDTRPRNYRGELLDEWHIKMCKELESIHRPPRKMQGQATNLLKQLQGTKGAGLIESDRSPLAKRSRIDSHQQKSTTATVIPTTTADVLKSLSPPTALHLYQIGSMPSIGSHDLHQSPSDPRKATSEAVHHHSVPTSIGSNGSPRSPSELRRPMTEDVEPPLGTTYIGLNDVYQPSLADVSPMRAEDSINDSPAATAQMSYPPLGTPSIKSIDSPRSPVIDVSPINPSHVRDTIGSIDSPRSPLTDVSHPNNSPTNTIGSIDLPRSPLTDVSRITTPQRTTSIGSIDSPRSPLADVPLTHLQQETSPHGLINSQKSPLGESSLEAEVDAMTDINEAGPDFSDYPRGATPVASAMMTTTPGGSPSRWSIGSLCKRLQGRSKKRSPLLERVNNANIHKVPKTPKKVSWPEKGPVTGTKRFVKNEAMSHPSPASSREDSSILSSVPSDLSPLASPSTQKGERKSELDRRQQIRQPLSANNESNMSSISSSNSDVSNLTSTDEHADATHNPSDEHTSRLSSLSEDETSIASVETPKKNAVAEPSTPQSHLSPKLEELTISGRRSSLRQQEKEDHAQKLRDAIAAEAKARKDKEEALEKARKDREEAEERARIKAEEEEERRKTGGRRIPKEKVIQSLPPGWDEKVDINMGKGMREQLAMTSVGNPLTRRDFGMVLPQPGTGDDLSGWLNDEIISGYLQAVVDYGHRAMGHPRGAKPRMHAFNPFFYTALKERGYDAVKRWSTRAKIGGNDLKNVEYVFIPCNPSKVHWTLVVVSPVRKTIEVFDSMHGSSLDKVETTKKWLRGELGRSYVDSEWTVVEDSAYRGRGKGPAQNNANDCGVFTVTTAKMIVLGVDPMAVSAGDMPLQRRCLVAELLNGGFSGDFEPHVVFE